MGMLYKQKGSKNWWMKYYRNGQPIRESTGTDKETEARRKLREKEGDIAAGRPVIPHADRLRFEELAKDFLNDYRVNGRRSLERAERSVELLKEHFTQWKAINITTPAVRAYIAKRQEAKAGNGTINRELAALKRMFSLAVQAEKFLRRPYIPKLDEHNVRTGFYGEVEFLALYEALPVYLKPVSLFAYTYGWRIKIELLGLTWDRVDLTAGTVRLDPGTTKNREGRVVVLTPDLKRVLVGQWQAARAIVLKRNPEAAGRDIAKAIPWAFHRNGERIKNFRRAWLTACRKAGLTGRIPHDFRRTAVRNVVRAGIPERVAMMISGHKTRSVFERYNIVSEGDLPAERLTCPVSESAGIVTGIEKENAATSAAQVLEMMVGRGRIELPTPGFSVGPSGMMRKSDGERPDAADADGTRACADSTCGRT